MSAVDDIERRFNHHPPSPARAVVHEDVRRAYRNAAYRLSDLLPFGRERDIALEKLEDSLMWANAAVARSKTGD